MKVKITEDKIKNNEKEGSWNRNLTRRKESRDSNFESNN